MPDKRSPLKPECRAPGALFAWFDVAAADKDEFYAWHDGEHMPERMEVPGFIQGRRYQNVNAPDEHLIWYDVTSLEVLSSEAYLARLNDPTDWTRRSISLLKNQRRVATRVLERRGAGFGGTVLAVHLGVDPGREEPDVEWLDGVASHPGIVGVHLCVADDFTSTISTVESRAGDHSPADTQAVLLVDGISHRYLLSLADTGLSAAAAHNGYQIKSRPEIFQLQILRVAAPLTKRERAVRALRRATGTTSGC